MSAALIFAIFGALVARRISPDPEAVPAGAFLAAIAGWLTTAVLRWVLAALAGPARQQVDAQAFSSAIRRAMALLLPFAVLAAGAELALGWQAAHAFVAAGLTSSSAAAASAAIRLGARPLRSVVFASLWSVAASAGWLWLWTLAGQFLGGTP